MHKSKKSLKVFPVFSVPVKLIAFETAACWSVATMEGEIGSTFLYGFP